MSTCEMCGSGVGDRGSRGTKFAEGGGCGGAGPENGTSHVCSFPLFFPLKPYPLDDKYEVQNNSFEYKI